MPSSTSSNAASAVPTRLHKLPPLPTAASLESLDLLRACIPAHRALSAFAQCCRQLMVADVAVDTFKWLNAAGAMQLDGDLISRRELLSAPVAHRNAIVTRYVSCADFATSRLTEEPVGSVLALELAGRLSDQSSTHAETQATNQAKTRAATQATTLRRDKPDVSTARIDFPSPLGAERLQSLLENWQGFMQQDAGSLDPLLIAAAAHGQWSAMRPFTRLNIATGQLLTSLLLVEEGLLAGPVLPLAHRFAKNSDNYWCQLNGAIRDGNRTAWLHHFLLEIEASALHATDVMVAWEKHLNLLAVRLPELLPKSPSTELLRLCANPSFGISDLADTGITRRQTATAWMQRLIDADLLKEGRAGKEKRYINPVILELILK